MTRSCRCTQWELGINEVDGPISLQSERSGGAYQFNQDYVFLFCPWCGSRLTTPCVQCDTPSDEHTGKTVYWQDEKNFCSPACVTKFEKEEIRR